MYVQTNFPPLLGLCRDAIEDTAAKKGRKEKSRKQFQVRLRGGGGGGGGYAERSGREEKKSPCHHNPPPLFPPSAPLSKSRLLDKKRGRLGWKKEKESIKNPIPSPSAASVFVFPLESLDAAAILNLFWSGQQAKEEKERRGEGLLQVKSGREERLSLSLSLSLSLHRSSSVKIRVHLVAEGGRSDHNGTRTPTERPTEKRTDEAEVWPTWLGVRWGRSGNQTFHSSPRRKEVGKGKVDFFGRSPLPPLFPLHTLE